MKILNPRVKQLATELLQQAMESDVAGPDEISHKNAQSVDMALNMVAKFNVAEMKSFLDELAEFFERG